MKKPLVLAILDGWGLRNEKDSNAVRLAKTPNMDRLWKNYPHTTLAAHGVSVGLPQSNLGGSEVGHLHIGAGRIIDQELTIINKAIDNKTFFKNKTLISAITEAKNKGAAIHIMGLLSDAGVHSHQNHLYALLKLCKNNDFYNVYVHAFLDGRDTEPCSAIKYIEQLNNQLKLSKVGKLATMCGRFFAMDRANYWDRTQRAYDLIIDNIGVKEASATEVLKRLYAKNKTDEFIPPIVISKVLVRDGDVIISFNYRSDRARQLATALTKAKFDSFKRRRHPKINFIAMCPYSKDLKISTVFQQRPIAKTLGELLSKKNFKQLRIAEKEKFVHVTYFFNGDSDITFKGEAHELVPSANVKTYDKRPAMSAYEITSRLIQKMENYDFSVVNFANGDMVGHTGKLHAAIKAAEVVDSCVGMIETKVKSLGGDLIITADHGNFEEMSGKYITSHTKNPVPFIIVSQHYNYELKQGGLANIAPTILELLSIKKPKEYTSSLIVRKTERHKASHFTHLEKFKLLPHYDKFTYLFIALAAALACGFLTLLARLFASSVKFAELAISLMIVSSIFALAIITVLAYEGFRRSARSKKSLGAKLKIEKVRLRK